MPWYDVIRVSRGLKAGKFWACNGSYISYKRTGSSKTRTRTPLAANVVCRGGEGGRWGGGISSSSSFPFAGGFDIARGKCWTGVAVYSTEFEEELR
jgi:hypothetical protein